MKEIGLLSYPRSGSNWLSYILETLFEIEVVGLMSNYTVFGKSTCKLYKKYAVIKKFHGHQYEEYELMKELDSLILLIRNPKECIISNGFNNVNSILGELEGTLATEKDPDNTDYMALFKLYEIFNKKKTYIFYEDLINNPEVEIQKLKNFLELNIDLKSFLGDFENQRKISSDMYKGSSTRGDKDKLLFHSRNLITEYKNKIDNHIKTNFPMYFEKYFKRYQEKQ